MTEEVNLSPYISLDEDQKESVKEKVKNEIDRLDIADNLKDDETLYVSNSLYSFESLCIYIFY